MPITIKRMIKEISLYWDVKGLLKNYIIATVFLIALTIIFNLTNIEIDNSPLYILLGIIWVSFFTILPLNWYFDIRPKIDKMYEEEVLKIKYKSLLDKFNKTN